MYIDNTNDKYEVSDFGRVLTILRAESEYEGIYTCKQSGENESVYLNVTCKIFVKLNIFILLENYLTFNGKWSAWIKKKIHNKTILSKVPYVQRYFWSLNIWYFQLLPF